MMSRPGAPSPPHRLPIPRRPAATGHRITHGGTIQKRGSFSNFPIKTPPASRQSTNTGSSSNQQLNHAPLPLPSPPASAELGLEAAMQPDANAPSHRLARVAAHLRPQMEEGAVAFALRPAVCRAKGGAPGFKVAILGAAGGIGQPLSLLMKMNPLVSVLHLYDVVNTPGVTADISHMDTSAVVRGFLGAQQLDAALTGMDLVIIPAGVPRKPGMTRDDLFNINAGIVRTLCEGVSRCCPNAIVNLISNPVNSTVPIAAEVFKKAGTYDPKRLLGVTTLDVARANTFVAEVLGVDPRDVSVPVVGGHAGVTILPLLSQVTPPSSFTQDEIKYLTDRIQNGGTEVVEAKAGSGSATLSMAFAAAKFGDACLRAMRGDAGIVECSYVASEVTELPFFASKVRLGRGGAEEILPLGPLNDSERAGLEAAKKELSESIQKGIAFVNK
ncbi:malate dehydrogenase, glyoxysomal-like isoform X2 [Sorghum bicolor]|uniref:malate dehydrogenase n=2 Tax=Sorghum bicolor TaxID=4558 RepID=A0A1B6QHU0_SORBI|nr:malate dehydrogenase, glyoxysomal-like isoform X2 [Sorghum bicolor]KXG37460.1 hypothetical protein SORBI_3001G073900 [Sorghum bicolor]|eukprot:XP_021303734.1 malate dehydrogenase, glyoxysomal-like isoform X2 [Sorghum bicolor]